MIKSINTMKFTNDQSNALNALDIWYDSEHIAFTLNGAAGTGKTTIVKEFINRLTRVPKSKIAVTAPTHKAKKVIQKATDFPAQTIQKLLGLRPNVNLAEYNPNRPVFAQMAEELIKVYEIVIIDESSMINKEAFELIMKKAKQFKVRVVFLGDEYQLPPIKEEISKVFVDIPSKSTLREIVRQKDINPMTIGLIGVRSDVQYGGNTGLTKILNKSQAITGDMGFKCLSTEKFKEELINYYLNTEYIYNKDFMKTLAWTNPAVTAWNQLIREFLLKEDASNVINEGELLMGYNNIIEKRTNTVIIQNSEDYIVGNITPAKSPMFDIPGFYVDLVAESGVTKSVFIIDHKNTEKFKSIAVPRYLNATAKRGSYWNTYNNFKQKHLCLVDIYIDDNKPKKFQNLLCKKDLDFGYALTVHKSQGSTYTNVAIDLVNIYKNWKHEVRNRLIYVALSRASNMNILMGM